MSRIYWLLMLCLFSLASLAAEDKKPEMPDAAGQVKIVEQLKSSLVQVKYTLKYDKGEAPSASGWAKRCSGCGEYHSTGTEEYVKEERPLEAGGILVGNQQVITMDLMMHPRFLEKTVVCFGNRTIPRRQSQR